jgi:hypothetical protein
VRLELPATVRSLETDIPGLMCQAAEKVETPIQTTVSGQEEEASLVSLISQDLQCNWNSKTA